MKNKPNKTLVSGYYEHPEDLVDAVKEIRERELPIEDILTPFPIHGLDELAGLKKSGIPTVGFIFGILGALIILKRNKLGVLGILVLLSLPFWLLAIVLP